MKVMKLSVIVPVYNVEKFLPRCLDSLLRQGLEVGEYEVICVNDGSPDGSAAILAEYERKHPEVFKVITQENRGSGAARNAGLKVARGEWVGFLDSDDYVIDKGYRYILDHFCGDGVDVVAFSLLMVYTDDCRSMTRMQNLTDRFLSTATVQSSTIDNHCPLCGSSFLGVPCWNSMG